MRSRKILRTIGIVVLIIFFAAVSAIVLALLGNVPYVLLNHPELQTYAGPLSANSFQAPFCTDFANFQGELYMVKSEGILTRYTLHRFGDGGVKKIRTLEGACWAKFLADGCLYYAIDTGRDTKTSDLYTLRLYNLETGADSEVCTEELFLSSALIEYAEDGSILFPLYTKPIRFIQISGDKVTARDIPQAGIQLGEGTCLRADNGRVIWKDNATGESRHLCHEVTNMIPWGNGLLLHCDNGEMLRWVDASGTVTPVFSFENLNFRSAMNVHGSDVYFSFIRFEKYGSIGMLPYENDTLAGTYRLSLDDFTCEKINDQYFDGLYILDDTGFYCTDGHFNVYKMDFDGNVTPIYVKSKLVAWLYE